MLPQQLNMINKHWKIRTVTGQFLWVEQGELSLTTKQQPLFKLSGSNQKLDWIFEPAEQVGRFRINHFETGEPLVDTVNGGYDCWSLEEAYNGTVALVSQGGLFRHFDYSTAQVVQLDKQKVIRQKLTEFDHWVLE